MFIKYADSMILHRLIAGLYTWANLFSSGIQRLSCFRAGFNFI